MPLFVQVVVLTAMPRIMLSLLQVTNPSNQQAKLLPQCCVTWTPRLSMFHGGHQVVPAVKLKMITYDVDWWDATPDKRLEYFFHARLFRRAGFGSFL